MGLEDVLAFNAWGIGVLVNKATDSTPADAAAKAELGGLHGDPDEPALPDFNPALTASVDLSLSGAASLNVLVGWWCSRSPDSTCSWVR